MSTVPAVAAFALILGQDRALALLERALARPSHAYLFVGPTGSGKATCAEAWIQALFCEHRTGCGSCAECRTVASGNHPDRHVWAPDGKNTTIDQVRELIRQADLAPYRAWRQIHVLDADTLNPPSANALLKTLEEPPDRTILLLLAKTVSDLLPTLVSRCQRIPFSLVPSEAIAAWLTRTKGIDPDRARYAAFRSGGRPGRALILATKRDLPATRLLESDDVVEALAEAEALANLPLEEQLEVLEDVTDQLRDVRLWLQTGRRDWLGRPEVAVHLGELPDSRTYWAKVMDRVEATRRHLLAAGNARLAWTGLACDLAARRSASQRSGG